MEGAGAANIGDFNIRGTGGWRANRVLNPMWQSATDIKCENSENVTMRMWYMLYMFNVKMCYSWNVKMWQFYNIRMCYSWNVRIWQYENVVQVKCDNLRIWYSWNVKMWECATAKSWLWVEIFVSSPQQELSMLLSVQQQTVIYMFWTNCPKTAFLRTTKLDHTTLEWAWTQNFTRIASFNIVLSFKSIGESDSAAPSPLVPLLLQ